MRRFPGFDAALLVLALGLPAAAAAQVDPEVGERVRVLTVSGDSFAGTLSAVSSEEMVIGGARGGRTVRPSEVAYLERSIGRHRRFGRNFLVSVLATGTTTGTIAAAAWSRCVSNAFLGCLMASESRSEEFVFGFVMGGAVVGVPLGVILGLALKYDRWEEIPLPGGRNSTVSITPTMDRGFGVATSISF